MSQSRKISRLPKADVNHDARFRVRLRRAWHSARISRECGDTLGNAMPRSYASDLLVDDFDLDGSRIGGYATRPRRRRSDILMMLVAAGASAAVLFNALAMQDGKPNTRPASAAAAPAIPLPPAAPAEVRKTVAAEPAPAAYLTRWYRVNRGVLRAILIGAVSLLLFLLPPLHYEREWERKNKLLP